MKHRKDNESGLLRMSYQPPSTYKLGLEVFRVSELRQRMEKMQLNLTHRIDFHLFLYVTSGACIHTIDFRSVKCAPGSLLALQPSQAQQFDGTGHWDGWLVIFRPDFLLPASPTASVSDLQILSSFEGLPEHMALEEDERHTVIESISQMYRDTQAYASSSELHALLRHQLYAMILRLYLFHGRRESQVKASAVSLQRFKRFKQLLEQHFATHHQVSAYADLLGCSEKSLNRATLEIVGMTAKACIASRINLEAKRLLAHTILPIALIGDRVGFDEPTNFVKFFRRKEGCSPGAFRRCHKEDL